MDKESLPTSSDSCSHPRASEALVHFTKDPFRLFEDADQAYGLQYFHESLTQGRAGRFGQVWGSYILPLSIDQPAVKHAFASYGTLRANNRGVHTRVSPFEVYCKSITSARQSLQRVWSPDMALILCNVLWVTEFEVKNWARGLMHVLAGIRIFKDWAEVTTFTSLTAFLHTSSAMYGSLPMELIWLTDLDSPLRQQPTCHRDSTTIDTTDPRWTALTSRLPTYPQPHTFTSFHEVYETCREISSAVRAWLSFLPPPTSRTTDHPDPEPTTFMRNSLLTWCTTFTARLTHFTTTTACPLDIAERTFCRLLHLRILACQTALPAAASPRGETAWDDSAPAFAEIVSVADALLAAGSPFTASTHRVAALLALLHTALKCRDPGTRARACGVLARCALGKGCRLGGQYAAACAVVGGMEEGGDGVRGPEERRFGYVSFEHNDSELVSMELWRRDRGNGGTWVSHGKVGLQD